MTGGLNEIQAGMYAIVNNFLAVDTVFLLKVRIKSRLNVFDDRPPTGSQEFRHVVTRNMRTKGDK